MRPPTLLVCRDPVLPQWQLGPLPPRQGRLTLIGWTRAPDDVEGGVPAEVASALAVGLTSHARVTFLESGVPGATNHWVETQTGEFVRALPAPGALGRLAGPWRGLPAEAALVSTRRADAALRIFRDPGFPWWQQGQVVLSSAPGAPAPDLAEGELLGLFREDWTAVAHSLVGHGIDAVVKPGVDGDVAGVCSPTEASMNALLEHVRTAAAALGHAFTEVPEGAL